MAIDTKAHTQLKPELVGKLVKIQKFRRNREEPGMIISESLETYVGTLRAYSTDKNGVRMEIGFLGSVTINDKREYLEVFDKSKGDI